MEEFPNELKMALPPEQIYEMYQKDPEILSHLDETTLRNFCESLPTDELSDIIFGNQRVYKICRLILLDKVQARRSRKGKMEIE